MQKEPEEQEEPLVIRNPCNICTKKNSCQKIGINNHLCLNYETKRR